MTLVSGYTTEKLSYEQRRAIPRRHIGDAIALAIELYEEDLLIDPKPSNFLYDPGKGFGIIDYGSRDEKSGRTKVEQVMALKPMLISYPEANTPRFGTPEFEAYSLRKSGESIQILNTFLDVLEADYPDILEAAAREQAEINANSKTPSSGMIYNVERLPDTPEGRAFRDRIFRLGLQGTPPIEDIDLGDLEVIG